MPPPLNLLKDKIRRNTITLKGKRKQREDKQTKNFLQATVEKLREKHENAEGDEREKLRKKIERIEGVMG